MLFSNSVSSKTQVDDSFTDINYCEDVAPVKDLFCSLVSWTQQNASKNTSDGLISAGPYCVGSVRKCMQTYRMLGSKQTQASMLHGRYLG